MVKLVELNIPCSSATGVSMKNFTAQFSATWLWIAHVIFRKYAL